MERFILVPKVLEDYIDLLNYYGYAPGKVEVIKMLAKDGLMQVLIAYSQNALGELDMAVNYIEHCQVERYRLPNGFDGEIKIPALGCAIQANEEKTLSLLLLAGLMTEGYYFLRPETGEYLEDEAFRAAVSELPGYDPSPMGEIIAEIT